MEGSYKYGVLFKNCHFFLNLQKHLPHCTSSFLQTYPLPSILCLLLSCKVKVNFFLATYLFYVVILCQLHAGEYQTTTTLSDLKQRVTICHISLCWLVSSGQFFYCTCYWLGSFTCLPSSGRSPKWAVS